MNRRITTLLELIDDALETNDAALAAIVAEWNDDAAAAPRRPPCSQ